MLFSRSHIRHLILILITFFFSQIQSAITVSLRYTVRNAGIKAVWCSSSFSSCSTLKRHKKKWYWRSATCLWLKRLTQLSDRGSRWWIEPWKGKKARNLSNSTQRTSGFAPSEKRYISSAEEIYQKLQCCWRLAAVMYFNGNQYKKYLGGVRSQAHIAPNCSRWICHRLCFKFHVARSSARRTDFHQRRTRPKSRPRG